MLKYLLHIEFPWYDTVVLLFPGLQVSRYMYNPGSDRHEVYLTDTNSWLLTWYAKYLDGIGK